MQILAPCSWQGSRYDSAVLSLEQGLVWKTRKKPSVVEAMLPSCAAAHVSSRESQNADEHVGRKFQIKVSPDLEYQVKRICVALDAAVRDWKWVEWDMISVATHPPISSHSLPALVKNASWRSLGCR